MVNRKHILSACWCCCSAFISLVGCSTVSDPSVCSSVKAMEQHDALTVLQRVTGQAIASGAGHLKLNRNFEPVSVSPDGSFLAWHEKLTFAGMNNGFENFATLARTAASPQTVSFDGHFPVMLAVSDEGTLLALTGTVGSPGLRLVLFNANSRAPFADLTDLISDPLSDVVQVGISGSGDLCVIGSRVRVTVISIALRRILFEEEGHSPALAPRGDRLALVNSNFGFVIRTITSGSTQRMRPWIRIGRLGGWSPDGRYLIAGGLNVFGRGERLFVVDTLHDGDCELGVLGMDSTADRFAWIDKSLLSR